MTNTCNLPLNINFTSVAPSSFYALNQSCINLLVHLYSAMKLIFILLALFGFFDISISKAIPTLTSDTPAPSTSTYRHVQKGLIPYTTARHRATARAVDAGVEYAKATCKGIRITQGMIVIEEKATKHVTPVRSQWPGDLVNELRLWGYREMPGSRDMKCGLGPNMHDLGRAFKEMGIDPRSSFDGGPNVCYHIEHLYGPAVIKKPDGGWPIPGEQTYKVDGKVYKASHSRITVYTR